MAVHQILRGAGEQTNTTHMKTNKLVAVIPGVIALAAFVLFFRAPVNADTLVGFVSVLTLLGIAAMEYGINLKRVFGR